MAGGSSAELHSADQVVLTDFLVSSYDVDFSIYCCIGAVVSALASTNEARVRFPDSASYVD